METNIEKLLEKYLGITKNIRPTAGATMTKSEKDLIMDYIDASLEIRVAISDRKLQIPYNTVVVSKLGEDRYLLSVFHYNTKGNSAVMLTKGELTEKEVHKESEILSEIFNCKIEYINAPQLEE